MEQLGPWRLCAPLGEGGMGVVWRAEHVDSGALAAVKTVRTDRAEERDGVLREIRALSRLAHPQLPPVLDHGVHAGRPWLAMALVPGETLRQQWGSPTHASPGLPTWSPTALDAPEHAGLTELGALPPRDLPAGLTLLRRLCAPLAYLHGEGRVHGDLKPSNVLLGADGWPVLVDFGIARARGAREDLEVGRARGTWAYMSPEQAAGEAVDGRSDLYALGCLLFELVRGQPPFGFDATALDGHRRRPAPALDEAPPALRALVAALLAKRPGDRPRTATAVAEQLLACGAEGESLRGPTPQPVLHRPAFVGREEAMEALGALIERPSGARRALVGAPGCGKTRVAQELARLAWDRGWRVLPGEALAPATPESSRPVLGPLARPLADLVGAASRGGWAANLVGPEARVLAELVPAVGELPGLADLPAPEPLPVDLARRRLLDALDFVLAAAARRDPVLLLVDDLHWADATTLAWWARPSPSPHLVAVGTAREGAVELGEVLPIEPLPSVREVAGSMLGEAVPTAVIDAVEARAHGSPLLAAELLREAVWRGALTEAGEGWAQRAPLAGDLEDVWARRLAAVEDRRVLEAAAVLGQVCALGELVAVSALPEATVFDGLAELVRTQLVDEPALGSVRFTDEGFRARVHAAMPEARRRALHRRAAALEAPPAVRAEHLARAGEPDRAAECAREAGAEAMRQLDLVEARRAYERAVELAEDPVIAAAAELDLLEEVLTAEGARDERASRARALFAAELPLALRVRAGTLCADPDVLPLAAELGEEALARARLALSKEAYMRNAFAQAEDLLRPVLDRFEALDAFLQAQVLAQAGWVHRMTGEFARAATELEGAVARFRDLGQRYEEARAQNTLAGLCMYRGETERAVTLFTEVRDTARAIGDTGFVGFASYDLAIANHQRGALEQGLAELDVAEAAFAAGGDTLMRGFTELNRAELLVEGGRHAEAEDALARAVDLLGPRAEHVEARIVALRVAEAEGDWVRQEARVRELLDQPATRGSVARFEVELLLVRALGGQGRSEAARARIDAALAEGVPLRYTRACFLLEAHALFSQLGNGRLAAEARALGE